METFFTPASLGNDTGSELPMHGRRGRCHNTCTTFKSINSKLVAPRLGAQFISHIVTESIGDVKVDPVISVGKKL